MQIALRRANAQTPGIPPSSLSSFLRANSSISGVVLTEFDEKYSNQFYATAGDTLEGINHEGIGAVAKLIADFLMSQLSQNYTLQVN